MRLLTLADGISLFVVGLCGLRISHRIFSDGNFGIVSFIWEPDDTTNFWIARAPKVTCNDFWLFDCTNCWYSWLCLCWGGSIVKWSFLKLRGPLTLYVWFFHVWRRSYKSSFGINFVAQVFARYQCLGKARNWMVAWYLLHWWYFLRDSICKLFCGSSYCFVPMPLQGT